ncbi:MAG: PIN domain-containing protein [Acidobacteria bacterium]|nr:MAG: PIN domain-containing protein [Acidobacteriota bacterium]
MIVIADSSVMITLLDRSEIEHRRLRALYKRTGEHWLLPSAILPEVDYLISVRLAASVQAAWLDDLAQGTYTVAWNDQSDLAAAIALNLRYADLGLGLVDALVMATAERLHATAIVTLDLRHFAAVQLKGNPRLWPRDA